MDVFKLLSRSANAAPTSSALKLPSNGAVANPQLFGHDQRTASAQAANKSRKRKRGQNAQSAQSVADAPASSTALPAELDFFGRGTKADVDDDNDDDNDDNNNNNEQPKLSKKQRHARNTEELPAANHVDDIDGEAYNVDECKRILRSHKLKITVLDDFAPAPEPAKKEKKKKEKKRNKDKVEAEKKKDAKKQLYPQPLTSFAQLRPRYNISRRLAENIQAQGYKLPTEVQLGVLPLLLGKKAEGEGEGKENESGAEFGGDVDLLTVAPTGSGKTIAFLIPIINAMLAGNKDAETEQGPRAVVVAPTRELASQIVNEARKLAKGTGIKATLMRKGMEVVARPDDEPINDSPPSPEASDNENDNDDDDNDDDNSASDSDAGDKPTHQKKQNRRRAERVKAAIIVTTPLALLNALKRRDGSVAALPTIRQLVLDEADVLLDPLFREQTLGLWNACTNPKLRVCLCSATMGSNIESLAISTLNTRWSNLAASNTTLAPRPPLIRLVVGLKDTAIPNISHQLTYAATEQGKLLGLRQLLHPTSVSSSSTPTLRPPFLVFTQTIPRAIALHSELLYDIPPEAGGSSRIAVLHADLSSSARDSIMTRFRRGEIWVLITTDLLARGVDFRGLNGVVNYDVPTSAAAYVHRVGRTGRAGREGGVAVTFYTQDDIPYVKLIANVIRASELLRGVKEEEGSVKQWLLDALPTPSKRERKELKKRGVESRRSNGAGKKSENGTNDKDKNKNKNKNQGRISTKSGYVRMMENKKRGAVEGSKRRERERVKENGNGNGNGNGNESGGESGFDDE